MFISSKHKSAYPDPNTTQQPNTDLWHIYSNTLDPQIFSTAFGTHAISQWTNRVLIFNLYNIVGSLWNSWQFATEQLATMPSKKCQTLFQETDADNNSINGNFTSATSLYKIDNNKIYQY